jgi:uncharacterized Rmd1/YagE family protein
LLTPPHRPFLTFYRHPQKSEQHSSRLEWIVIWLIVVEIVLGLVDILYNIFEKGSADMI